MTGRDSHRLVSPDDVVRSGLCIGCGSCAAQASGEGASMRFDPYGQLKPDGPSKWLHARRESFSRTCPFSPLAANEDQIAAARFPEPPHRDTRIGSFSSAYVGAVAEPGFREDGSSGGMVTWVAAELLRRGLVDAVAHVVPARPDEGDGRFFRYTVSRTEADLRAGAKSRYYPIELSQVLEAIRTVPGRYAVVGIPCFIKALHLLRAEDPVIGERLLFTLGLFCGHMKSARFAESFAWQLGVPIAEVQGVEYRRKDPGRPANWYTAHLALKDGSARWQDWWHLADGDWGAGFFQNSACNFCDDVVAETADISFGDAWVEPYSSDGRGTNVAVVRSPVLQALVDDGIGDGRLELQAVDADFIVRTQAAGFRQRREGLAWRLTWPRLGVRPIKRVAPRGDGLPARRKLIYWMRSSISAWSHRMFWLARSLNAPRLYVLWARAALATYQGLAYSRGRIGKVVDRLWPARDEG